MTRNTEDVCEICGEGIETNPVHIEVADFDYEVCSTDCGQLALHYIEVGIDTSDEELTEAVEALGGDA